MTDRFTVRAVVVGLIAAVFACIVAAVVLALNGTDLPEFLKYVGTTALGAFAGVLSKTNTEVPTQPTPVTVVDQPVATTDVPAKPRRRREAGHADLALLVALALIVLLAVDIAIRVD